MKSWIKVISVVVLIGFIAGSFAFYFLYNKPHPDFEKAKADYTLAASALYKDYLSNKAGSGVKYNGKVIDLTSLQSIYRTMRTGDDRSPPRP